MYNKSGLCLASTKYGPWTVSAERQGRSVLRWEFHASDDRLFALAELTHAASPLRWANMKTSSRTFPCIFFHTHDCVGIGHAKSRFPSTGVLINFIFFSIKRLFITREHKVAAPRSCRGCLCAQARVSQMWALWLTRQP